MREIRTSGGRRSEATGRARHVAIEARTGKPRNRTMPKPKHFQFLAYSTSRTLGVLGDLAVLSPTPAACQEPCEKHADQPDRRRLGDYGQHDIVAVAALAVHTRLNPGNSDHRITRSGARFFP
jgi:hypothetical protein